MLVCAVLSAGQVYLIQEQKYELQRSVGASYQDSDWGFGQTTAVLLWGPLFNDIVHEILGEGEHLLSSLTLAKAIRPPFPHRIQKNHLMLKC